MSNNIANSKAELHYVAVTSALNTYNSDKTATELIRENNLEITGDNTTFYANIKTIKAADGLLVKTIMLSAASNEKELKNVLVQILRFEALFDGVFFTPVVMDFNKESILSCFKSECLPFYKGNTKELSTSFAFPFKCSDDDYNKFYGEFSKLMGDKGTHKLTHQVYMYSDFLYDITVDLRCALLLQVFENLFYQLSGAGLITFPQNTTDEPNFFREKLSAVVNGFQDILFENEDVPLILDYGVNLRNRIFHVDNEKDDFFSGHQAALYILKFALLYRLYIMELLGITVNSFFPNVKSYIKTLNQHFTNECKGENVVLYKQNV